MLCRGVLGQHARQRSQLADEELKVDLERLACAGALAPRLRFGDTGDLLREPHAAMAEELAEAHEAVDLVDVHRLAVRDLPKPSYVERKPGLVSRRTAPVHAQLTQVEQDAVVEMALIDVGADLTLVRAERLGRALCVQHKSVGDEVDRREVRLESAAPELREVGIGRELENPFDDVGEDPLREQFLVLAGARSHQVLAETSRAVEFAVAPCLLVQKCGKPRQL